MKDRLGIRMYLGLYRIAEAQAKLHLKDTVDEEIANQTMESVQLMMVQYGETIKATTTPKTVTYMKFLEILESNNVGVDIRELCKTACKEDQQIAAYLGNNWSIAGNSRVDVVVGMLRNQSHVKDIKSKPVVLQWMSKGMAVSDISDICESKSISEVDKREQNITNETDPDISHIPHSEPSSKSIFIKCPQCKFENIHQDVIDHHIKYGHDLETR